MLETKIDAKKTVLLIIDMQNDLVKAEEEPYKAVAEMAKAKGAIGNAAKVVGAARGVAIPIVFIAHVQRKDNADVIATVTDVMLQGLVPPARAALVEGSPGADFVEELRPTPGDHVVRKRRSNAFYNSDLELILRARGIDTVIVAGAVTDGCVVNTVRGARERDLHVIVLSDCCVCVMPEDDEYFMKRAFPKLGRVRTSDEVMRAMSEAGAGGA